MERHRVLLLEGAPPKLAMADPLDPEAQKALEAVVGHELQTLVAPLSALRAKTAELYHNVDPQPGFGSDHMLKEAAKRWGFDRAKDALDKLGGPVNYPVDDSTHSFGPLFWISRADLGRIPPGPPHHVGLCRAHVTSLYGLDGLLELMKDMQVKLTPFEPLIDALRKLSGYGDFIVDTDSRLDDIPAARRSLSSPLKRPVPWHPPKLVDGVLVFFYNGNESYQKISIRPDYSHEQETLGRGYRPPPMRGRPYVNRVGVAQAASVHTQSQQTAAAQAWRREASYEHASVASFSRASLELMAHGAPMALLERTHRAALDELEHTRLCMQVAKDLDGQDATLGPVPALPPRNEDMEGLAVRTLQEAYLPERCAVAEAKAALALTRSQPAQDALQIIIEDETRHCELALDILRWCLQRGGASVQRALKQALARVPSAPAAPAPGGPLQAHGLLDDASRTSIAAQESATAAHALLDQLRLR